VLRSCLSYARPIALPQGCARAGVAVAQASPQRVAYGATVAQILLPQPVVFMEAGVSAASVRGHTPLAA